MSIEYLEKGPSKRKRDLLKVLGSEYELKVIDLEWVIYRNFNNGFDIEVSGIDSYGSRKIFIFLWQTKKYVRVLADIMYVPLNQIKEYVDWLYQLTLKLQRFDGDTLTDCFKHFYLNLKQGDTREEVEMQINQFITTQNTKIGQF